MRRRVPEECSVLLILAGADHTPAMVQRRMCRARHASWGGDLLVVGRGRGYKCLADVATDTRSTGSGAGAEHRPLAGPVSGEWMRAPRSALDQRGQAKPGARASVRSSTAGRKRIPLRDARSNRQANARGVRLTETSGGDESQALRKTGQGTSRDAARAYSPPSRSFGVRAPRSSSNRRTLWREGSWRWSGESPRQKERKACRRSGAR